MISSLYWIDLPEPGRLAIMARPRAGDWLADEVMGWLADGVDLVISLLEPEEVADLELQRESELCRESGIEFISFPVPDRGVPASTGDILELTRIIGDRLRAGKAVAVHCRAGIGRSSLVAACAMVESGYQPELALNLIRQSRGLRVPDTDEQKDWITAFSKAVRVQ